MSGILNGDDFSWLLYFFFPKVCVMKEPQMLEFAAEQFVGKNPKDVEDIILQTIEGHFRAILGLSLSINILIFIFLFKVCVMKEPQMLEFAAEQFVGKSHRDFEDIILQTIEGHFRAILGLFVSRNL